MVQLPEQLDLLQDPLLGNSVLQLSLLNNLNSHRLLSKQLRAKQHLAEGPLA